MKATYHYKTVRRNEKRRAILSSLGAALALARYDIESTRKPALEPLYIESGGIRYGYDDILNLTDTAVDGRILVCLPIQLRG